MTDWKRYGHAAYVRQMRREMSEADSLYVRANELRTQGRTAEADKLDRQAVQIDKRHYRTSYSSWLSAQ